ncbi:PIR Superfamily Protein [Plasmodium ovale wallikeri]|uniref:PIR Superfamily Protein n=1 Tax=Plasmodium ovale wallikeri TaxID=864142 RepID=A0A1A9AKL2_PLAOA|nr:PIR Superfamily Protein [Plasmodium ovale wallikeri]SBT59330.1 PIR Superfamily Protein [Plasmodium ovale wallikeri]
MSPPGKSDTKLPEKVLPSNYFIKCLFGDDTFENHIRQIEENKSCNKFQSIISIINNKFEEIFQDIRDTFSEDEEVRCCRNVNYYFDLLYAIIKSPGKLSNDNTNNLISEILKKWNEVPQVNDNDKCKRETDLDSICKRSILKHIHDLKLDKMFIKTFSDEYKNYLHKQWEKIIVYTSKYYDNLFIKIENDFIGIIEPYNSFLESSDTICDIDLDDLSTEDIKMSTNWESLMKSISLEKFTAKSYVRGCYNKNYIDMLKMKASSIQRINNILSSGIAILGFSLILVFLYRFGPLKSLLRGCTKKKAEVNENINEEVISELYDDSENERSYISYHTVSH